MFMKVHRLVSGTHIRVPEKVGNYDVIRTIGKGGFAIVVLGKNKKTNEFVAIKVISREEVNKFHYLPYLENELRLSSRFDHPNVVKILDIIYEEENIMVIMEYFENGDLQTLISKGNTMTYEQKCRISIGILEGLTYLHKRGISHRDIKPDNILFDSHMHPKLIDFGLSKEKAHALHTYCGTPYYMAPEVILTDEYNGMKADVWAYAVTIHVLVANCFPWDYSSEILLAKAFQDKTLELKITAQGFLRSLIEKALIENPKLRPTSGELLNYTNNSLELPESIPSMTVMPLPNRKISILPKLLVNNGTNVDLIARKTHMHHDKCVLKLRFQRGFQNNY